MLCRVIDQTWVETRALTLAFLPDNLSPLGIVSGRDEFLSFVALTEDELDEVCDKLRRKFGAGIFSAAGASRKEQVREVQEEQ